jgi:NAD(P)-dependent dehydrogenase (short-subunit alcohol dehydrogenase family)
VTAAVVVGGASGIGAAVAAAHPARSDDVLVWDVGDGADVRCDITDPDAVGARPRRRSTGSGSPTS